jgi:hypothetical protein
VIHYIDNTSAIAALVKGYSGSPDSMGVIHAFAEIRLALGIDIWFQGVPSKANIADLPSRAEFDLLHRMRSHEVPLVFPPMEAFAAPIGGDSARALNLPAPARSPRFGSIGVAHIKYAGGRPSDVDVRRGKGPLGNPFPLAPSASRSAVCSAFARVLKGEDPAHIARDREGPALPIYKKLVNPAANARRERAIEDLARVAPSGGRIRLICVCFPKQCHAMSIAKHVRARAEALAEATEA